MAESIGHHDCGQTEGDAVMAKVVGLLVLTSLFGALFIGVAIKIGLLALLPFPLTFLVVWAVGAVISDEWWPFRW